MIFQHSPGIWADFPELVAGAVHATGITAGAAPAGQVGERIPRFTGRAEARLAGGPESEFPEIQAWRRAFARMGVKPTQYRCASESLLRRYRRERALPRIHPLIDLCNAVSLAYAIPVAALDVTRIKGDLQVRRATGEEAYLAFSGATEHPEPNEVIFADEAGQAHARRWTNRQSGLSAVREGTREVFIIAEALHGTAAADVPELVGTLVTELAAIWPVAPTSAVLSAGSPAFDI